jgi:DNA polymerase-1
MARKLLIDGDIYAYQIASSCQEKAMFDDMITSTVNVNDMKKKFKSKMSYLQRSLGLKIGYILFSGPTNENFRKEILPTYKENRKSVEKPLGHKWLVEWITAEYPALVKKVDKLEADDLMGIMATRPGADFMIVSEDKDMQTIPCPWYSPSKDKVIDSDDNSANWYHMYQTLMGDQVDNYTGLPGVGPKNAAKILQECANAQERWVAVVDAYGKAGLEETDALVQARVARILHWTDYNMKTKEIKLWKPQHLLQTS